MTRDNRPDGPGPPCPYPAAVPTVGDPPLAASPLRFGVAIDTESPAPWQCRVLAALAACDAAEVAVVLVVGDAVHTAAGPAPRGGSRLARSLHGALAGRIAGALGAGAPDPATVLAGVARSASGDAAPGPALDVVLDLTAAGAPPAVAGLGRQGCWRFRFGPPDASAAGDPVAAFVAAALAGHTSVSVALAQHDGAPLRVGAFGLAPHVLRTSAAAAASSFTAWPAWCAEALARGSDHDDAPFGATPAFDAPEPVAAAALPLAAAGLAARAARELGRRALWAEVWTIGLAQVTPAQVVAEEGLGDVRWLKERGQSGLRASVAPRAFAADPFLYDAGDRTVCLFEALDYDTNRGWIAAVDVSQAGPELAAGPPAERTVFQNEWHWSYPFVLVDGGETYCIPETADAGGVLLHRLTPAGFEQEADLLPGVAALDSTIVRHDGRYWLFCTLRDGPLLNTALHLFVADHLAGPYRPHRHNPVKLDIRSARPAGTIFAIDGVLYRPGQDCGEEYGAALVIHRIDELSEAAFRETPVAVLRPSAPYGAGLHTLSFGGGWAAIDAKRHAFSPRLLGSRVTRVLRRR